MLILSIETSGKNGGVALARGDGNAFDLVGEAAIGAGQYSAELIPRIVELLGRAKIAKHDLDGFAVASGPGSFTGLRVGIATVKALADTLQKPVAAVSVLEAIAVAALRAQANLAANDPDAKERKLRRERITALLDAGRGEVYVGEYAVNFLVHGKRSEILRSLSPIREMLVPGTDIAALNRDTDGDPLSFTSPDERIADALREQGISIMAVERPGARDIARLGIIQLVRGQAAPVADFDANYIRRSDAEIFSLPKIQGPRAAEN